MSTAAIPGAPLPVRTPGSRARGRHRRPERPEIPSGAQALVLAVPATAGPESRTVVEELLSIIRSEQNGVQAAAGYLSGGSAEGAGDEDRTVAEILARTAEAGLPMPVLVPLVPGPHDFLTELHALAAEYGAPVTDALGPHPLLAEAVHVRLSEAGLARADRARLFAIATAADGVVLTTVGGEDAAAAAGITGVLLAARLAVPVVSAALDVPGSVAAAVNHLKETGSQRPALAPLVIGPEADSELLATAAEETGCPSAAPLGAYPTVGQLIASTYLAALPTPSAEDLARAEAEAAAAAEAEGATGGARGAHAAAEGPAGQ
ncbi:sirohydrochlorin chelatase [Kitasatospora sp. NPDC056446]|uniref:sirohydrochlorin chelatase n=1 Tax=Kitasatospora sp. NPDC056446 TaxID=3345819 RepID=UPI0036AAEE4F